MQLTLSPQYPGTSPIGNPGTITVSGPNLPLISPGDVLKFKASGLAWTSKKVQASFAFQDDPRMGPFGTTDALGNLFATLTVDSEGIFGGMLIGVNFDTGFGMRSAAYVISTPAPPPPAPAPSIATLAAAAVGGQLLSLADFCGSGVDGAPAKIPYSFVSGGVTDTSGVGYMSALSDAAAAKIAGLLGATVFLGLPCDPDPRGGSYQPPVPQVNWLRLPDGRIANAGYLGECLRGTQLAVADIESLISMLFTTSKLPGT